MSGHVTDADDPGNDGFSPFLDLSAEMRNMIYPLCFDFEGVSRYLIKYRAANALERAPSRRKTPTIFLLNRQIFQEASSYYAEKRLVLKLGPRTSMPLTKAISSHVLTKICSITINGPDKYDCLFFVPRWRTCPLMWYIELMKELGIELQGDHKLQELNINLPRKLSKELCQAAGNCARHPGRPCRKCHSCGVGRAFKDAVDALKKIRKVKKVSITGFPPRATEALVYCWKRTATNPVGFLDLPLKVRQQIYDQVIEYPDYQLKLHRLAVRLLGGIVKYRRCHHCSVIFRLSRQIATEAKLAKEIIVHERPLTIRFPKTCAPDQHRILDNGFRAYLFKYLDLALLVRVKYLTLDFMAWQWLWALKWIAPALSKRHLLKKLTIIVRDDQEQTSKFVEYMHPSSVSHHFLGKLAWIKGVGEVNFEGILPNCYTIPLKKMMQGSDADEELRLFASTSKSTLQIPLSVPTPPSRKRT